MYYFNQIFIFVFNYFEPKNYNDHKMSRRFKFDLISSSYFSFYTILIYFYPMFMLCLKLVQINICNKTAQLQKERVV